MHRRIVLILTACAGLIAGCGSSTNGPSPADPEGGSQLQQGSGGEQLSADSTATVLTVRRTINAGCRAGGEATPDVKAAVSSLMLVLKTEGPNQIYEVGSGGVAKRLTLVVDDISGQLKRCGAADEARRLAPWVDVEQPSVLGES